MKMASSLEFRHTSEAIRRRLARGVRINYLRDWIYGAIDRGDLLWRRNDQEPLVAGRLVAVRA